MIVKNQLDRCSKYQINNELIYCAYSTSPYPAGVCYGDSGGNLKIFLVDIIDSYNLNN